VATVPETEKFYCAKKFFYISGGFLILIEAMNIKVRVPEVTV